MAINLVLSQVVGQAFIVKPDGEVVPALPNTAIESGDVVSVPNGKNAWLVTEEQEQVDVLDEALILTEEGFSGLDLPSDVADIIAAIEEGDDPTQQEGTETAAGEAASSSALTSQVIIEGNTYEGQQVTAGFDTTALTDSGVTSAQIESLGNARYGSLFSTAQDDPYTTPTFSGLDISAEEDGEIILSREDILGAITGGDSDNIRITAIRSDVDGVSIKDHGDGSFTLVPPPNYNGDISFTVDITDGTTSFSGNVNIDVAAVEDLPEITLTPVALTEDENVSEGSPVATISASDGDGDTLTVSITNDPNGYFRIEGDQVVLTEAGAAAIDDDILNLSEITVTVSVSDGKNTVEESVTLPITRTDDDATLEGDLTGTVTDGTGTVPASASGSINVIDPDSNNETTLNDGTYKGEYGTLVVKDGNWTYTVDKEAVAPLAEGEQATDVITITASDGSTHDIVLNIEGTNDPALISGDISATIVDNSGALQASGQLNSADVDGEDNTFIAETIPTLRGELTINEDGSWSYVSNDPTGAIKALGEGETLTEYVTVRAADGTEQQIEITFQGVNDDAVFSAISTGEITESDGVMSTIGTINVVDADNGESFMQAGTFEGSWGSVVIDAAGNWSYTASDSSRDAIQSLTDGEKLTDTITVYSVDGSETQITISINGTNDDAVIGGDITATITDNGGTMSTSGTLTSTDVDGNDNKFIAETITTPRGEVTIDENGNWTYTTTDPTGAIQRLPEGETLTEVVTVRAEDGTEQQIVLTIEGVNDAPVFSAISSRDVYETNDVISVSGSINIVDPDAGESFMLAGTYMGDYGSVTIDRAGNWTFTSDPAQSAALDTLSEGERITDTITVRSVDGTETELTVTIIGTNDPAQIAGDIVGTIVEADGTMSTSGQLTSTDVDGNDNTFTPQTITGRWGELTIDADGSWTYSSDDAQGAINRLGEGDQLTDTLSVRAEDGTVQTLTITIDGTNDAAVFGGKTAVTINETDSVLTTSGRATVSDADYGEYFFQPGTYNGSYGEIVIDRAGNWTYTSDPANTATFDALDAGDSLPETITVLAQDGTPLDIQITIQGTDDLPVVSGEFGGSLTDTTDGVAQAVSGTLSISDVDADDTPAFDNTRIEGKYGVLELTDGEWTYTLDKDAASTLNPGELDTDVITLTASDGTQQSIVISVTGTNDEPVLRGDTIGSVSDGGNLTTSGTIDLFDPDTIDTPTLSNDTIDGQYGTLVLDDGEWTYTLDPDSVVSLPDGETTTDVITVTASDGSKHDITITITGTDQEPVLTGNTTGNVTEGSGVLTTSGTVGLTDADEGENPTLPSGTFEGQYGSLELVNGNWTYTLDPELAQYLDEGQTTTDTISITASDGTVHDIVITITGSEDAAELSGDTSGSVTDEAGSLTTGGSLTISDPDANDNPTLPDANQQGQYGTFNMVDGHWTYTLDPELAESLDAGVTVTDTITITDSMGGKHDLVISVTGTEDAATLTGDTTGNLVEGVDSSVSGTVSLVDPDSGDVTTIDNTELVGQYGTLTLTGGEWTYTLSPGAAQSFGAGESTTETFTLTDSEGTDHQIVITIEGSDDAPVVTGDFAGAVSTATGPIVTVPNLYVLGDDADSDGKSFGNSSQPDSLHFNNAGFTATITDSDGALTNAAQGDTTQTLKLDGVEYPVTVTATVDYTDAYGNTYTMGVLSIGESQNNGYYDGGNEPTTVLVQIDGPAIVPGTELTLVEGSYTETSAISYLNIAEDVTTTGSIGITDADANDTPSFADTTIEGIYGTFTLDSGEWTYTLDPDKAAPLKDGEVVQDVFTLTATDNTEQQITISITGSDDAAYVSGDLTATISDDGTSGSVSGSITITDPDAATPPTLVDSSQEGEYGSFSLVNGQWTYTVDPDKAATIPGDQSETETFTVSGSDGSQHTVTVSVTGIDNAAVVSGVTTGSVNASGFTINPDVGGSLSANGDAVDNGSNNTWTTTTTTIDSLPYVVSTSFGYSGVTIISRVENDGTLTETDRLTYDSSAGTVISTSSGDITAALIAAGISPAALGNGLTQSNIADVDGETTLFLISQNSGSITTWGIGSDGSLSLIGGLSEFGNSQSQTRGGIVRENVVFEADDGTEFVFVTRPQIDRIDVLSYDPATGALTETGTTIAGNEFVSSIDIVTVGGETYLAAAGYDGVTLYAVNSKTGALTQIDGADVHIGDGTSVNFFQTSDGRTYAVTSGSSDDNTTVFELNRDGTLTQTDSITDAGAYMSSAGYIDGEPVFVAPNPTSGVELYTLSQDGKLVLQTHIPGIENDYTPPVIVQTADGSYFLVDADGNATTVKLDVGTPADITASGTLSISDVDSDDSPYFENTTVQSTYGTLTLTDGAWTYVLDETKSASLAEGETTQDVITLTASDGTEQQIAITVTGSDDKPVVTGNVSAQISEDSASQSVTGTLAITDPDAETPPAFNNVTLGGSYGTLVLVDGVWTYTLNANAQTLTDGEQQQEVFTLTATDGTVQEIVITVTGENDASVITGTFSGSVTEGNAGDVVSTSGSLSVSDADGEAVSFEEGTQVGNYGTFTLINGEWTYTLDHNKADSLNEEQQVTDTFTVKATDGTTQAVSISVTGTEDAAIVTGDFSGTLDTTPRELGENLLTNGGFEDWGDDLGAKWTTLTNSQLSGWYSPDDSRVEFQQGTMDGAPTNSNTNTVLELDGYANTTVQQDLNVSQFTANGDHLFALSFDFASRLENTSDFEVSVLDKNGNTLFSKFFNNDQPNDHYVNFAADVLIPSGTDEITVSFSGKGDSDSYGALIDNVSLAPVVNESFGTVSGSISISDADANDTPYFHNATLEGEFGTLVLTNGHWEYTFDTDKTQLIDEETLETFVVTDSEGGKHEIVIALQGTDDAPLVTGVFTGAVTEGNFRDEIKVSGTISITDPDADDTPEFLDTQVNGTYGTLTLENGVWTYELDSVKADPLSSNDCVQDVITLTATDGTVKDITISITGTNDEPFIVGTNSATLVAPDEITKDYVDIANVFWLNDGYSFSSGDMQYIGNHPPEIDFHKSATVARIYDTDSIMDGDGTDAMGTNEYVYDTTQKVEVNGVLYNVNFDYTIDYKDASGNVYTFAVVDIDYDNDRWHNADHNEQGNFLIQMSGPTITAGTKLAFVDGSLVRDGSLNYQDIAAETATFQAHGALSIVDLDANDSPSFANTTVNGQYGTLVLDNGNWTYTLDPRSTPTLGDNDSVSEVITLTADNGYQTQVNVTIGGSDTAIAEASLSGVSSVLSDVISLDDVTFAGTDNNDRIGGSISDDVLVGGGGNDIIHGHLGNDIIDGGLGDDLIIGGEGNDLLAGGSGSDTFAFLRGDEGTAEDPAVDHIVDFDTNQDTINLSDLMGSDPAETLESYLSLIDDGNGNAVLNISTQGDGNVDQQVVFDNMSLDDMASAYAVDTSGMTTEQISTSVIDAMILQNRMIVD